MPARLVARCLLVLASFMAAAGATAQVPDETLSLAGWKPIHLGGGKTSTHYDILEQDGVKIVHAVAHDAASGLAHDDGTPLTGHPWVRWRWKISGLIEGEDNSVSSKEDAPARLIFLFDGDKSKLSLSDRTYFKLARTISGFEPPYAMLMYVWAAHGEVGSVIRNPHTDRVQMVVVASGAGGVGEWQKLERNLHDDYLRAFGEEPGRLLAYGVMTDTDNTHADAEAWYGPIDFKAEP
ncbi:DUF3047 domain-containing protein [Niveibacterium sp. SC-1]|uniref:DUF3047 domain-containing protein n=1 Tax=Niveibacterium sp. SC-1 TaxID=3135646 RepID=UPI00311D90D1